MALALCGYANTSAIRHGDPSPAMFTMAPAALALLAGYSFRACGPRPAANFRFRFKEPP